MNTQKSVLPIVPKKLSKDSGGKGQTVAESESSERDDL